MKMNLAQIWPGERGKREFPFSEELLELAVLAKTWKDLTKTEPLSSSRIPLARQHLLCCRCCCCCAVLYLWCELYLLLGSPGFGRTALILSPMKCLADLETSPPSLYVFSFLKDAALGLCCTLLWRGHLLPCVGSHCSLPHENKGVCWAELGGAAVP